MLIDFNDFNSYLTISSYNKILDNNVLSKITNYIDSKKNIETILNSVEIVSCIAFKHITHSTVDKKNVVVGTIDDLTEREKEDFIYFFSNIINRINKEKKINTSYKRVVFSIDYKSINVYNQEENFVFDNVIVYNIVLIHLLLKMKHNKEKG